MIVVICSKEYDDKSNTYRTIVSHGVDTTTDRVVVLPNINIILIGAKFDPDIGEYILEE